MGAPAIIVGILILVFIVIYIFNRNARKGLFHRMNAGVGQVKMGVALFLNRKYSLRYDEEMATKLAVAVVNELFGDIPTLLKVEMLRIQTFFKIRRLNF